MGNTKGRRPGKFEYIPFPDPCLLQSTPRQHQRAPAELDPFPKLDSQGAWSVSMWVSLRQLCRKQKGSWHLQRTTVSCGALWCDWPSAGHLMTRWPVGSPGEKGKESICQFFVQAWEIKRAGPMGRGKWKRKESGGWRDWERTGIKASRKKSRCLDVSPLPPYVGMRPTSKPQTRNIYVFSVSWIYSYGKS